MALGRAFKRIIPFVATGILPVGSQPLAHSWYPAWCCSENDCRELFAAKGEIVTETEEGYRLWDGRFIRRDYTKPSPDRHFHICEEPTTRAIVCFFTPQGES